jgi:hypothetical protein
MRKARCYTRRSRKLLLPDDTLRFVAAQLASNEMPGKLNEYAIHPAPDLC